MTLEQIKNKQVNINCVLSDLLERNFTVVNAIVGYPEDEKEQITTPYPDFLLGQISFEQERTEILIEKLFHINERLSRNTYATSEVSCVERN